MEYKTKKIKLTVAVVILLMFAALDAWLIMEVPYALDKLQKQYQAWATTRVVDETEAETEIEVETKSSKEILEEESRRLEEITKGQKDFD